MTRASDLARLLGAGGTFSGDLTIPQKIIHSGDTDTHVALADNQIDLTAGDVNIFQGVSNEVVINQGSADVNFRVESNGNANMLVVDGGNDNVGIGGTGNPTLYVVNNSAGPALTAANATAVFHGSVDVGKGGCIGFDFGASHTNYPVGIGYVITSQTASTKGDLCFYTRSGTGDDAPSERMRIHSGGAITAGTTSAGSHHFVYEAATGGNAVTKIRNSSSNSSNQICLLCSINERNDTNSAFLQGNNGYSNFYLFANGTHSFTSDENRKKNIETTRDGYLEDLAKLRVVKYNWKEDEDGADKELGLIAQEVEKVFPKLVMEDLNDASDTDETKFKMIKTSVLPMMLLKALQEANTKITALEAKINSQETNINDLQKRVTALEGS